MKVNKYIISALVCPFVLGSCADWDDWKYDVEKPQTIAQYEYLNDYAPLKEYLDRGAHPGFKVSAALGADEFNQQGPLFRLAAHNFDEIVAGNAMKMASCVDDQGVMDFSKVSSFVTAAEDAGVSIYGHTLAWHAQQPKKWLEKLIKDKELPPAEENPGLIITSGEPKANPWDYEIYYDLDEPLKAGTTYEISLNVRGTNSGTIDFWPGKKDGSDTQYGAGSFIVSKSAVDNSFSFTPKKDMDRMRFCFGKVGGTLYFDNFVLKEKGSNQNIVVNSTFDENDISHWTKVSWVNISYKIGNVAAATAPLTPQEKSDTLTWAMNKWVSGMMQATGGKVKAWDLINEAISGDGNVNGFYALQTAGENSENDFFWQDYFTPEMYGPIVEKAARDAYAAVEGTTPEDLKLFINDYNLESDWDNNKKVKSLVYWIGVWEKKGQELGWNTKIDGIGSQMHISYYENEQTLESKKRAIQNMLKIMAESGKLVRISELDMGYVDANGNDVTTAQLEKLPIEERVAKEKAMAEYYKWIIEQYFAIVPVSQQYGICQWCLTDSPTDSGWRPGQPVGLWNLNYQRKPAYGGFADGLANKKNKK
ncbi:glycosyl hydrolase family 10 [Prevotella copri]|uniref:Beta-xylanase n=1 Tax=Segatella copri TaxID=165179 RepID=A0AA91A1W1_9BACT|nr:endo-1,4-beta-xylanase [Segatella copri]MQO08527.1 glycosyl hydrolase family 10 [Segatella copri]